MTGLATALEMGIKNLRVISDSNLVVCHLREFFFKRIKFGPVQDIGLKDGGNFLYIQNKACLEERELVRGCTSCVKLTNSL